MTDPAKICNDIYKLFQVGSKATEMQLFICASELRSFFIHHPATPELIEPVCQLERKVMAARGANKQAIEERIFETLGSIELCPDPDSPGKSRPALGSSFSYEDDEQENVLQIALVLSCLSQEVLKFYLPNDRFNNRRKALAMQLLWSISIYFDVPGFGDLCITAISSGKDILVSGGIEAYRTYLQGGTARPTEEMLALLDNTVMKTMSRSVAVAALTLQVETGVIGELEALSRIDEWKSRHRGW